MRGERNLQPQEHVGAVDAVFEHLLLERRRHRLAIDAGFEVQEVVGVLRRQRDNLIGTRDRDVGHREGHERRNGSLRAVVESIADADFLGRDKEIL